MDRIIDEIDEITVEELITEWSHSAETQLEAMSKCDIDDLEKQELRDAIAKAHPGLLDNEIEEMLEKLIVDLMQVREAC